MSSPHSGFSSNGQGTHHSPADLLTGSAFKGRGRQYLGLLTCPVDGAPLRVTEGGVQCSADPTHHYPVERGILRLAEPDQRAHFDREAQAAEVQHRAQGWRSPAEDEFKALPQTGLGGYPPGYWEGQAISTALLWRFLEAIRLREGGLPIGPRGEAAVLGAGMGWLAYALDVAGYTTLAIDTDAGEQFGLGVYPYARDLRVQADPTHPPLAPEQFDLIVIQDGLAALTTDSRQHATLEAAVRALRPGHWLAWIDAAPPPDDALATAHTLLDDAGMDLMAAPHRHGWRGRLLELRDRLRRDEPEAPPVLVAQKPGG